MACVFSKRSSAAQGLWRTQTSTSFKHRTWDIHLDHMKTNTKQLSKNITREQYWGHGAPIRLEWNLIRQKRGRVQGQKAFKEIALSTWCCVVCLNAWKTCRQGSKIWKETQEGTVGNNTTRWLLLIDVQHVPWGALWKQWRVENC